MPHVRLLPSPRKTERDHNANGPVSGRIRYSTWGEDPPDMEMEAAGLADPPISTRSRDLAALNKLRTCLDNPIHPWATLSCKIKRYGGLR